MTASTLAFRAESAAPGAVVVDLDRLVASRGLITGNSGAGKSTLLRYVLEQTHERIQQIVLDPEGEFPSLRERLPYVLAGGGDADVPADPKTAKLLCRRLLELGASAVVDLYDLKLPDRRRFVRLFLDELMHLPRRYWRPLLVVIDECHVYCPERGAGEAESTEAVITLATQGRKRGYALLAATQRLSKLHKDCAAELLNVFIGRTGLDVDVKRAGDILGFDREARAELRTMEPHTWYAFGPALSPVPVHVRTGATQTTQPRPGEIAPPAPPPPAKIQELLQQMRDLEREAEEEARTVDELRARVARLERELRAARKGAPDPDAVQRAVDRALQQAANRHQLELRRVETDVRREARDEIRRLEEGWRLARERGARAAELLGRIGPLLEQATELLRNGSTPPAAPAASSIPVEKPEARESRAPGPRPRREPRQPASPRDRDQGDTQVGGTPQRMLDAMALLERLGISEPTRENVAGFCTISANTGTFRTYLSQLRRAGLIEDVPGMRVRLTDAGRAAAAPPPSIPSLEDLHRIWFAKLGGTPARMLEEIIACYPEPVSREKLAGAIGISHDTGTFRTYLSQLRRPGLIRDIDRGGDVVATELLFPEGL